MHASLPEEYPMFRHPSSRGSSSAWAVLKAAAVLSVCLPFTVSPRPQARIQPASQTRAPQDALSGTGRVPVIFDDDGSPDGTAALLYLLNEPAVSVKAVSISHGESHPRLYIQLMGRMLDDFGFNGILLGAGQDRTLSGGHDFPEWLIRSSGNFWGLPLRNPGKIYPVQDSPQLMVSMLNRATDPVTIFVSGPCTNLAMALRLDPGIRKNIRAVVIMGGAVHVPGNLSDLIPDPSNKTAEWNIYVDPQAAEEVFTSGLAVTLVPLDATDPVRFDGAAIVQLGKYGAMANLTARLCDMLLKNSNQSSTPIWDLTAAEIMVHPDLCGFERLHLEVVTEPGDASGRTAVLSAGEPNVNVCLKPDAASIKQRLAEAFLKGR
jgi:pyrimidine-specific ribonucleoside hydrolase